LDIEIAVVNVAEIRGDFQKFVIPDWSETFVYDQWWTVGFWRCFTGPGETELKVACL
jgi:hypothetical protein